MGRQFILVSYRSEEESLARLSFCEFTAAGLRYYVRNEEAFGGRCGFTDKKREGDLRTPVGAYEVTAGFGAEWIPDLKVPYTVIDSQVWVDDSASEYYNTMQPRDDRSRWKSAEKLKIPAYRYALVTDYNLKKPVPGKGSAIFLHCRTDKRYTEGCIALQEAVMLTILQNVDICKKPVIIIYKANRKRRTTYKNISCIF